MKDRATERKADEVRYGLDALIEKIEELEKELDDLQDRYDRLESDNGDLRSELKNTSPAQTKES